MTGPAEVDVRPLQGDDEVEACARLMAGSEPWLTLGRDCAASRTILSNPAKEVYWIGYQGEWAGFLILDLHGPFRGYLQTICLRPELRGAGLGTAVIGWAEARIFRESPNVFMCVSDFNDHAKRLYVRLGYEVVGELRDFLVPGHSEVLLRKTTGTWQGFQRKEEGGRR
jgi:ribosomal protein S18 acetylase RimI-like enzyme